MKKILFFLLLVAVTIGSSDNTAFAQQKINKKRFLKQSKIAQKPVAKKITSRVTGNETAATDSKSTAITPANPSNKKAAGTVIGTSTYDLQTNNAVGNRLFIDQDGGVHATWTYSNSFDISAPDRGTGYVYSADGGETWGGAPDSRLEPQRNGWPSIAVTESGRIIVVSHFAGSSDAFGGLSWMHKDPDGEWIHGQFPVGDENDTWARMAVSGNTLHVIAGRLDGEACGLIGGVAYFRSKDAGDTWEALPCIEGLNIENFARISGDSYAIDANGDNVAIAIGAFQVNLFKSTDGGDSFTRKTLNDIANPRYDGTTPLDPNIVSATDESYATLIDDNGDTHIWYGRYIGSDTDGAGFGYFPDNTAIMYWNEGMGDAKPKVIGQTVKQDSDGDCEFFFDFNESAAAYRQTLVSMPSAGMDADGNLYVTYSAITEDGKDENNNYRKDLFAIKSLDGGATWIGPLNITNDPTEEAVYGSVAKKVDSHLHVVYMSDALVGTGVDGDFSPQSGNFVLNEMRYVKIPVEDIKTPDPIANTCPQLDLYATPYVIQDCEINIDRFDPFVIDYPDGEIDDQITISGVDFSTPSENGGAWVISLTDSDGNEINETISDVNGAPIPIIVYEDTEAPIIIGQPYEIVDEEDGQFYYSDFDLFDTVDVLINTEYTDLGAIVIDDSDSFGCPATLTIDNTVNTDAIGSYSVTYNAVDNTGKEAEALARTVNVVAEDLSAPQLSLAKINGEQVMDGDTVGVEFQAGGTWEGLAIFAYDNIDGDITDQVAVSGAVNLENIATYQVDYSVEDASSNSTSATVYVRVADTQAPALNLKGPATVIWSCGTPYDEATFGYTAFDNVDGDISDQVTTTFFTGAGEELTEVCVGQGGTYRIVYKVTDSSGNEGEISRNIIIPACDEGPCSFVGAAAACDDGIQNGDETGVDCGGSCDPCVNVGINDIELQTGIRIFPNPTKGALNISIQASTLGNNTTVQVYNLVGELVQAINKTANTNITLDLANMPTGVYMVKINTDKGAITHKVVLD